MDQKHRNAEKRVYEPGRAKSCKRVTYSEFIAALEAQGYGPTPKGKGHLTRCPCHDDENPSLHSDETADGGIKAKCFACAATTVPVLRKLGLIGKGTTQIAPRPSRATQEPAAKSMRTYPTREEAIAACLRTIQADKDLRIDGATWKLAHQFDYVDAASSLVEVVLRFEPVDANGRRALDSKGEPAKAIRSIAPYGDAWVCKQGPKPRPLLRLPSLLAHPASLIVVCEGELKAALLQSVFEEAGSELQPTSWAGGADGVGSSDWK